MANPSPSTRQTIAPILTNTRTLFISIITNLSQTHIYNNPPSPHHYHLRTIEIMDVEIPDNEDEDKFDLKVEDGEEKKEDDGDLEVSD